MDTRTLQIHLKDDVIVSCMDYTKVMDATDATRRTLEAFVLALRARDKVPTRSPEEIQKILGEIDVDEVMQYVELTAENKTDDRIAQAAAAVEKHIATASTPQVREDITLSEADTLETRQIPKINLFTQERKAFAELKTQAPKDRFIEEAVGYPEGKGRDVYIAAVEVVYSNLPKDLWGSEKARQEIATLVLLHSEEAA